MTPTDYIQQRTGDILTREPTDERFTRWDDGSVECVVGDLLFNLVRILQPQNVVESGTYKGKSSAYIALALKENRGGHLTTLEIEEKHLKEAKKLWLHLGLADWITEIHQSSLEYSHPSPIDLLFLDTEPALRFAELERFYPEVVEGGFILIHDLPRGACQGNVNPDHPEFKDWPFGPVPEKMRGWLQSGDLSVVHFPTPRELALFYKRHSGDWRP